MQLKDPQVYGMLAEFTEAEQVLAAANRTREAGYTAIDAFTPFPIHGLSEAVGFHRTILPTLVFIGAVCGAVGGFFLQYWYSKYNYPMNIGGRPLNSWPAFIIITFECTILAAALTAVIGMLALNGLPQPYHPLFNVPQFGLASSSHFFLVVKATDPKFDTEGVRSFLAGLNPASVALVPTNPPPKGPVQVPGPPDHLYPIPGNVQQVRTAIGTADTSTVQTAELDREQNQGKENA